MARLIDADALLDDIQEAEKNGGMGAIVAGTLKRFVKRTQTIDPESLRPHGRWVFDEVEMEYSCSECGCNAPIGMGSYILHKYCPNCGAKMDEEET